MVGGSGCYGQPGVGRQRRCAWLRGGMVWDGTGAGARAADVLVLGTGSWAWVPAPGPEGARGRHYRPPAAGTHRQPRARHLGSRGFYEASTSATSWCAAAGVRGVGVTTVLDCAIVHQRPRPSGLDGGGPPGPELRVLIPAVRPTGTSRPSSMRHLRHPGGDLGPPGRAGAAGNRGQAAHGRRIRVSDLAAPHAVDARSHPACRGRARPADLRPWHVQPRVSALARPRCARHGPPADAPGGGGATARGSGTWVVSTISIYDMFDVPNRPERMNHPLAQLTVPRL